VSISAPQSIISAGAAGAGGPSTGQPGMTGVTTNAINCTFF
jgi:hypothetical protein